MGSVSSFDVLSSLATRDSSVFNDTDTANHDGIYNLTKVTSDEVSTYTYLALRAAESAYDKCTAPGKGMNDLQRTALNAKIAEIRSKWADGSEVAVPTSWGESACRGLLKLAGGINKTLGERTKWVTGEALKAVGAATVAQAARKANEDPLYAVIDTGIGLVAYTAGRMLTHGLNVAGKTLFNGAHSRERAQIEEYIRSNEFQQIAQKAMN